MVVDLLKKNRSYRKFDESKKIARETLLAFVDGARYTASSVNLQPLKYFISSDEETNGKIFPMTRWAKALKDFKGPQEGERPTGYIIICIDKEITPNPEKFSVDVGIVAQAITTLAVEKGLGCCMIQNFDKGDLIKSISLPENFYPDMIIAIGTPAEEIVLEEANAGEKVNYYRDENYVHHVPKRKLTDIVIK